MLQCYTKALTISDLTYATAFYHELEEETFNFLPYFYWRFFTISMNYFDNLAIFFLNI